MRRKDLRDYLAANGGAAEVTVQRVEQYRRWRVVVNGDVIVTNEEVDCLCADLERIAAWLTEAGVTQFTVLTHESS